MTTIYSRESSARSFSFSSEKEVEEVIILPDLNFNIAKNLMDSLKNHIIFNYFVSTGIYTITEDIEPEIVGQKDGLDLTDLPEAEAVVVNDQEKVMEYQSSVYTPSAETLMKYSGVGPATAAKILSEMPEGGWSSKDAFLDATISYEIDWTNLKAI
jgi:hypothetical protein